MGTVPGTVPMVVLEATHELTLATVSVTTWGQTMARIDDQTGDAVRTMTRRGRWSAIRRAAFLVVPDTNCSATRAVVQAAVVQATCAVTPQAMSRPRSRLSCFDTLRFVPIIPTHARSERR